MNESTFTITKKYHKFFSEIWLDVNKTIDVKKFSIILLLGGKNRGKSYVAFEEFYNTIRENKKVVYLRNSKQEIDNIKFVIASEVEKIIQAPVTVKNEGIFNKFTKEIIVLFASSKSYNNLSGNTIPFSLVFYDEYNQNLTTDMMVLVENFLLSMNTLFRTNDFKIIVCGNTKTQNNLFFNLYHINPPLIEKGVSVYNWDDYLLCIRYDDEVFSEFVGSRRDMQKIQTANPYLYEQMFLGKNYGFEDELIINQVNFDTWAITDKYLIYNNRIYRQFFKVIDGYEYIGMFYIGNFTNDFNYENKEVYTADLKLLALYRFKHFSAPQTNNLLREILNKIASKECFFNDYILYNYIVDNKWCIQNDTWQTLI